MNVKETHIMQGMTKDLSVHKFNPNMAFDARNIRITALKDNKTLLAVTNEKGTKEFSVTGNILGTIIGTAVLNSTLVVFTTTGTPNSEGVDRIYRLDFTENYSSASCVTLFEGQLQMDYAHPLETLPIYENEQIQKVYWVDGKNQPRMLNINAGYQSNPDVFNFNRKIEGKHTLSVEKYNTGGEFPAGTIQYCFNYFNKFGQETNIVDVSALYYLSPKDKGLPADAISTSSFVVTLEELDTNYEYVRLYSIVRTSENASPNVRIVGDYKIQSTYSIQEGSQAVPPGGVLTPISIDQNHCYLKNSVTGETTLLSSRFDNLEDYVEFDLPLPANTYIVDDRIDAAYYLAKKTRSGEVIDEKQDFITIYWHAGSFYIKTDLSWPYTVMRSSITSTKANNITCTDNGLIGSTIDATALLFIGGQNIVAGTMTSKDSTLFLGDIKQNVPNIGTLRVGNGILKDSAKETEVLPCIFGYDGEETSGYLNNDGVATEGFYDDPVNNNRSSYDIKSFKARENYRLGFIAQYKTGQWSEVIWLGDYNETFAPGRHVFYNGEGTLGEAFVGWGPSYRKPGFKYTMPQSIVDTLINNDFIRVAPVVVFPKFSERKVLFQGILSGTVFNVNDRYDNSPFAQADWRFRSGYSWENIVGEIQCNPFGHANTLPALYGSMTDDVFVADFSSEYYRDPSILTFFSPDIEALDDLYQSDLDNVGMRIVGISNLGFDSEGKVRLPNTAIDTFLYTKTQGFDAARSTITDYKQGVQPTIRRTVAGETLINYRYVEGDTDLSYSGFRDVSVKENNDSSQIEGGNTLYKWVTYVWHRNGSLNDQPALTAKAVKNGLLRYGLLDKKCISEIKYALTTFFQNGDSPEPFDIDVDINTPKLFDSTQLGMEKFDSGVDSGLFYYGNIDKVITTNFKDLSGVSITSKYRNTGYNLSNGYPIYSMGAQESSADSDYSTGGRAGRRGGGSSRGGKSRYADGDTDIASTNTGKDPVSMKYKSTKHLMFGLNTENGTVINQLGTPPEPFTPFWKDALCTFNNVLSGKLEDTLGDFSGIYNSVFIAEIYRKFTPEQESARFGGTTDDAITNNTWIRCGDSQPLEEGSDVTLYFKEGDTYVGRYDCLKVYPFTDEDQNQIVSIYSTEVESRVNLDARYDKNKGLLSNLYMRPTNFNLFNHPGYEQTNQYFTYKALDYARYNFSSFPNLVTWSLEKKMGADIDAWTSIPMTSTFDANGELGKVNKLISYNDAIFMFQNRGVVQVLFNERVQIPAGDGKPIEITNGYKFGGLRYLSNQIGLSNKWSLQDTPYGIYFIDDEKNALYQFNGQQFTDLSSKEGLNTWLAENNSYEVWNPVDYSNFRTFYDKVNRDLYFVNKNEALVYSELAGHFTSFMDYDALPALVNMSDRLLTFKLASNGINTPWEMFAGQYNMFFGVFKPFWITFISNANPTIDKVYNNLAWRSESFSNPNNDSTGIVEPRSTFDTLRVWNDHQDSGEISLEDIDNKPSPLKKKFNVFRTLVPRDNLGNWNGKGMNRIRNPWTYIQLKRQTQNTELLQFHDLDVDYFI